MIERKMLQKPVAAFVYRHIGLKLEFGSKNGFEMFFLNQGG
jgi:mannitol-specific phosphotransferase system IIBC component